MPDKVDIFNILSTSLGKVKTLNLKGCAEIKFAHGGHLFACVVNQKDVFVFNFYTHECPPSMIFTGHHVQKIRCIEWNETDRGFTTCCHGGNIYFFDLFQKNAMPGSRNSELDFTKKDVKFTSLCHVPNQSN